jgi:NhaP-type Na+/H+ or K+/H+ antiporter
MFTTGFAIFLGLVFIFIKLPRRTMLRWLRYDVILDVAVTLVVLAIHFGTFSGVMAATFAGLLTSVGTTVAKRLFGYIKGDEYFHGLIRLAV